MYSYYVGTIVIVAIMNTVCWFGFLVVVPVERGEARPRGGPPATPFPPPLWHNAYVISAARFPLS